MNLEDYILLNFTEEKASEEEKELLRNFNKMQSEFINKLSAQQLIEYDKIMETLREKQTEEEIRLIKYVIKLYKSLLSN